MTTKVDHDYPVSGNLCVTDEDTGAPVASALVKIYRFADYPPNPHERDVWVASTTTDELGNWKVPVFLPDSETWVVEAYKRTMYKPSTVEITT